MKEITKLRESVRIALIERMTKTEGWKLVTLNVEDGFICKNKTFFNKGVIYIPVDDCVIDEELEEK